MLTRFFKRLDPRLIIVFAVTVLLWNTVVAYPLKIFVVFLHEISHGIAAILTGGRIIEIQVVAQQGGHAITAGGSRFWTLSAGYLGSMVWGGVILVLASRTRLDRFLSIAIGVVMVVVSVLYLRNRFGFLFGLGFGLGLIAAGRFLPEQVNDWILKTIGLTSCLYAILDIKSDVIDRADLQSDARMLAELTHIPTLVWGGLWILIAVWGTLFVLYVAGKDKPPKALRMQNAE